MWFVILKTYYGLKYYSHRYYHRMLALRRLLIRNKMSRKKVMFKFIRNSSVILLMMMISLSIHQIGQGSYIYAKAILAQYLIESAWQKTLDGKHQVKPWSWADTWPVAKLTSKQYNTELFVLAGDNGRTLAFAPGYRFGTVLPGGSGNSIISGHRDTHFSFLQNIKINDKLEIENAKGELLNYRVSKTEIVSTDDSFWIEEGSDSILTLVTCYPFDSIMAGGKLRYIVTAENIDDQIAMQHYK